MNEREEPDRPDGAGAGPSELPEHLFRQGDDWTWLKAARRERRRKERRAQLQALGEAVRENRALVLAVAAPVAMLGLAWLLGAVR